MSVSPFDSAVYSALLGDGELRTLFDDAAHLRDLLTVEAALARAQGRVGIVPGDAAERIAAAAEALEPDAAAIAAATAQDGVPIRGLLAQLRAGLDAEAAGWVHHGATSQDIVDTAAVLRLRRIADLAEARAAQVQARLARLARAHRTTLCVGRTRTQQAVPTSFGLRAVAWLRPLARERARLGALREEVLKLQLGGAAGNLSALQGDAPDLVAALAEALDLGPALPAWHGERDGLVALGDALARLAGAVGKLGLDVARGCRSEVGELRLAGAGGSSAMPHKTNPVAAETLVALARHAAAYLAELHQAQLHGEERDGIAWTGEWLALPQVAAAALSGLGKAAALLDALEVDTERMAEHASGGLQLPLAEAAGAALAPQYGKAEAERRVAAACARAVRDRRPLLALLAETADAPVDWRAVSDPAALMGRAPDLVDRALAEVGEGA